MYKPVFLFFFFLAGVALAKPRLYLLPGHGSDERVFSKLHLAEYFDTIHIHYPIPFKNETMKEYALRISWQIDASQPFSLLGVSLGGMIAVELNDLLNPEKVIIVSSAANKDELPARYLFVNQAELDRVPTANFYKNTAKLAQKVVEPDRKNEAELFNSMLARKVPLFIKRAAHLIVNWERSGKKKKNVFHIHGTADRTIPIRNIEADYIVENGSHMMALTCAPEITRAIMQFFSNS